MDTIVTVVLSTTSMTTTPIFLCLTRKSSPGVVVPFDIGILIYYAAGQQARIHQGVGSDILWIRLVPNSGTDACNRTLTKSRCTNCGQHGEHTMYSCNWAT